jgi:hypothetical protein
MPIPLLAPQTRKVVGLRSHATQITVVAQPAPGAHVVCSVVNAPSGSFPITIAACWTCHRMG